MTDAPSGYPNPCPTCGAKPFMRCRSLSKGKITDTHAARVRRLTEFGSCPVCGRQYVPLARKERYGTRPSWLTCADERACFAAWLEDHYAT